LEQRGARASRFTTQRLALGPRPAIIAATGNS
jgi:hypothetical protein